MRTHLATLVEDFRRHAGETAVVAHRGNRRHATTYGELARLAGRFSAELERRGVAPGDRVVIWGENSAEWIAVFFGCLLRAAIAVPLDAAGAADFAARVIRDTAPKLIVGDAGLLAELDQAGATQEGVPQGLKPAYSAAADGTAEAVPLSETDRSTSAEAVPLSETTAALGRFPTDNLQPATPRLPLADIADHLPAEPLFVASDAIRPHTPIQIVFTSGTTAEPRGIVHTHRNILATLAPIEREMQKYLRYERWVHPLRFLHSVPLSHVFGQFMGLWCPGLLAAEVHFPAQHEPARIADLVRRERISVLIAVPRVLHLLRAHLLARFPELQGTGSGEQGAGESSQLSVVSSQKKQIAGILKRWWRFRRVHRALGWKFWAVISGGATLPAELEIFWNHLGYALIQGYGMTETAALVTLNHPFHIAPGTIGKALPGREVRITGEGEILVRGDMLAESTWSGGAMHQREGEWLATGDLAEKNASGELRFLGRKGDVIVTSAGLNIHPGDLESALAAQPGVRAVVVVPCDLATGPEPVAVVLAALSEAELQAAVDAANRTLADYQQIRRVLRWPELQLPYTSTGKLLRRQVAEWACATLAGRRQFTAPSQDALLALIAEVTGEPLPSDAGQAGQPQGLKPADLVTPIGIRSASLRTDSEAVPLSGTADGLRLSEDLHLDSLGRVQLQSALEQRFSLELEDDAIAAIETVGELRALLERNVDRSQLSVVSSQLSVDGHPPAPGQPTTNNQQPATAAPLTTDNRQLETEQHVYPHWPWTWPIQAIRAVWIELIVRPLVWLLTAPRVTYTSHLEPRTPNPEPLLIICNHITLYDGAFVLYALPGPLRRRVAAAMSGQMLADFRRARNQGNPLLNLLGPPVYWLLTALFNVFPLPNARGFRRSFVHTGEALDRGYSVLIFPEGTRSRTGEMNPFRPGIGLLAQQSRVPILPVAVVGLYDLSAPDRPLEPRTPSPEPRRWFRSGRIEVRVGELIPAADDLTDPAELTARLERAVRALL